MKTVEDIERLTPEELERMADDKSVAVPESLGRDIENRILAFEMIRRGRNGSVGTEHAGERTSDRAATESCDAHQKHNDAGHKHNGEKRSSAPVLGWRLFAFIPAAAAAVAAVIVGLNFLIGTPTAPEACGTLADTFSTPEEAYAQVEKTFALIGGKVGRGKSIADAAVPKMRRTSEILNGNKQNSQTERQ